MNVHWDGIAVAVAGSLASLSLAFSQRIRSRFLARRAKSARPVTAPVPAGPKRPVTASNRAMRERRANVVWSLPETAIADKLGLYDAELADLQALADEFDGADDEPRHTR